jgi:hypothetical protein
MRFWLSDADTVTTAQTAAAERMTMLASLVRIVNRLRRRIWTF